MTSSVWQDQPRRFLDELTGAIARRAAVETTIREGFESAARAAESQYRQSLEASAERLKRDLDDTDREYLEARGRIVGQFQSQRTAVEEQYDQRHDDILAQFADSERAEQKAWMDRRWEASAVFEAQRVNFEGGLGRAHEGLKDVGASLESVRQEAERVVRRRRLWPAVPPAWSPEDLPQAGAPLPPAQRFANILPEARERLAELTALRLSSSFENHHATLWAAMISMIVVAATALVAGIANWYWIPVAAAAMVALSAGALAWLRSMARPQSWAYYESIVHLQAEAQSLCAAAAAAAEEEHKRQVQAITATLNVELTKADDAFAETRAALTAQKQEAIRAASDDCGRERTAVSARHNAQRGELEEQYARRREAIEEEHRRGVKSLEEHYQQTTADRTANYQRQWSAMSGHWLLSLQRIGASVDAQNELCERLFPAWDAPAWSQWRAATEFPAVVPVGRLDFDLAGFENGMSDDPRLAPDRTAYSLPLLFPLAERSLVLIRSRSPARHETLGPLRSIMLRMLTGFPPGKVRFLVLDPQGLGEGFAAFMHLADFNEKLISHRIWTEPAHIEQRLAELTAHMENVIQVYLRNEFESLHQYNASAGELAEPYRVLIVAGFPSNFTELAARRLSSVVQSGCRCGVYTLMTLDAAQRLPRGLALADLAPYSLQLEHRGDEFLWSDPQWGEYPIAAEPEMDAARMTELVRRVGRESVDADRVELPFDWVVANQDDWWTADSRSGLEVPLGRAGVNSLQRLSLGKGTSQHVLVAGKTGSGKSTLLHVMIVNAALRYAPDELQLYLVDFKKGVEFKAYAEQQLPHARVVAIESEREFGLSVLEHLDGELKRRGDLFRAAGVQDVPGFRELNREEPMPRLLLVIDEFQELFVEDDRVAQKATLLLDRLVRQGRAFGIHVMLGSQTLAGAYSLARSTIGQMAVRIALQCSESDAHLILSEENTAARLLARPGEAIYNDANGLYEGNHPFQIVWLPDAQRRRYLEQLRTAPPRPLALPAPAAPAIVFEGNVPADPANNAALAALLAAPQWPAPASGSSFAARAWLGEPVAIQPPTEVVFHREAGSNVLVVGHSEEAALGVFAAALVSLAAQHSPTAPGGAKFYLLVGSADTSPHAGFWSRLPEQWPHDVRLVRPRQTAEALGEIAGELARREAGDINDAPPVYLFVFDLAKFRDLRKQDDDFGLGRYDGDTPAPPSRLLRTILHDGPAVGIHSVVWVDGYNALLRSFDRHGIDNFETRVVFRINPSDSSSLIDTPAAAQLGLHRAILDDQRQSRQEKFRPYGPPRPEWLAWVRQQWRRAAGAAAGDAAVEPEESRPDVGRLS